MMWFTRYYCIVNELTGYCISDVLNVRTNNLTGYQYCVVWVSDSATGEKYIYIYIYLFKYNMCKFESSQRAESIFYQVGPERFRWKREDTSGKMDSLGTITSRVIVSPGFHTSRFHTKQKSGTIFRRVRHREIIPREL